MCRNLILPAALPLWLHAWKGLPGWAGGGHGWCWLPPCLLSTGGHCHWLWPMLTPGGKRSVCENSAFIFRESSESREFIWNIQNANTCGRQSGRASKMTRRTPMGTVICSSSRLWATLVLCSTRPTLSWAATAICRRPMAKLLSLAGDKLRRFNMAGGNRPIEWRESKVTPCYQMLWDQNSYKLRQSMERESDRVALWWRDINQTVYLVIFTKTVVCLCCNIWQLDMFFPARQQHMMKICLWICDMTLLSKEQKQQKINVQRCERGRTTQSISLKKIPAFAAWSMSILLAARISSFLSVNSSARWQMISLLWQHSQPNTARMSTCIIYPQGVSVSLYMITECLGQSF